MRDHLWKGPVDSPESSPRPLFSVHPGDHRQCTKIGTLIGSHETRTQRGCEVLALGRSQPTGHFLELNVSRAEIVHDRVTGDVVLCLSFGNVSALAPDYTGEFQLVVQLRRLERPRESLVRADDRAMVSLVVNGHFVPLRWDRLSPPLRCRGNMVFKRDKIAERSRIGKGSRELNIGRRIHDGSLCRTFDRSGKGCYVIFRPACCCDCRSSSFKELQHGGWNLRVG